MKTYGFLKWGFLGAIATGLLAMLRFFWRKSKSPASKSAQHTSEDVRVFYNQYTDKFLEVYGQVIQAFRTKDVQKLLDYELKSMGLEAGQTLLDAGCGVCAPAIYFASQLPVRIEAVTISEVQASEAANAISHAGLEDKITVKTGDYHELDKLYPPETFDIVYFLESFGHAHHPEKVLQSAWKVLKPGGTLYIKDLFRKIAPYPALQEQIDAEIGKINAAYRYNVSDLNNILDIVRKIGYVIMSLNTIDIPLEDFENLTISNDFQELTGVGKITNWEEYVFPIDFFELKCYKPLHDLSQGAGRYFLQNLYYMQIEHRKPQDL
ncbi:MAG: class I SAM-dependent methyltransferase [Sphingobacteriales bacterium]|nr:MAG: class I SAM-dependent methyltransferase [Sphingobacteriales bacterium]